MNWANGFSAAYYAAIIDPRTWTETGRLEIVDGNVKRESSDLRDSADFTAVEYDGAERWVRLYLEAKQAGDKVRTPLFTGLTASPTRNIDGNLSTSRVDCYSVLKPCADVLTQRGYYIPAALPLNNAVRRLLDTTPAPVEIEGDMPALESALISEDGETALSLVTKIIKAIDWTIQTTGDGTIHIRPRTTGYVARFDAVDNDMIEPEITYTRDWYSLPNVFRAVSEDTAAVARDESTSSPLSIQNRGREIWAEEDSVDLAENESLAAFALRKLKELQNAATKISYNRRYDPDILPGDSVYLHYPNQGIDGAFTVSSQSITLDFGATTAEEVKTEGTTNDEEDESDE